VFDDIGVDAAKTGMLHSRAVIETVAAYIRDRPLPLVVDPVMVSSSGARLLQEDAVGALVTLLFPLATVITPNLHEAISLVGDLGSRAELAAALHRLGARAVIVTGGHGDTPVDLLYDGSDYLEIAVERLDVAATHGAGCTHSATLAALLAGGMLLFYAARGAAAAASRAVAQGLVEIGGGDGPVDVLGVAAR
jgi:hydroxymethylpyrimidine/phosphomethylpyrimidine kinase